MAVRSSQDPDVCLSKRHQVFSHWFSVEEKELKENVKLFFLCQRSWYNVMEKTVREQSWEVGCMYKSRVLTWTCKLEMAA